MLQSYPAGPAVEAAVFYARDLGWAVVPGCDQGEHGRRCGRPDCLTATPHPISARTYLSATCDEAVLRRWWRRGQAARVLLAVGHRFDILDAPARAAEDALIRLDLAGYRLRPVAETSDGRVLIWVRPLAGLVYEVREELCWPYADLGLHRRGVGDYVVAPPSGGARWLEPPVPFTEPTLPHCADIMGTVAHACRRLAQNVVGPRQRPGGALGRA
jgi:hypothetical protein